MDSDQLLYKAKKNNTRENKSTSQQKTERWRDTTEQWEERRGRTRNGMFGGVERKINRALPQVTCP